MTTAKAKKTAESDSGDDKTATLKSPWGSKVTVAADQVENFLDSGYTK